MYVAGFGRYHEDKSTSRRSYVQAVPFASDRATKHYCKTLLIAPRQAGSTQRERSSETTIGRQYETVGKTALLRHWAGQAGIAATYWVAECEQPTYQRRRFYARLLGVPLEQAPIFETWPDLWHAVALHLDGRSHIILTGRPRNWSPPTPLSAASRPTWSGSSQNVDSSATCATSSWPPAACSSPSRLSSSPTKSATRGCIARSCR